MINIKNLNDLETRLIILYSLVRFKLSVTQEQLNRIFVESELIDYFILMHYVTNLTEMEYITSVTIDGETRYIAEESGIEMVGMFEKKIPIAMKAKIDYEVRKIREEYLKKSQTRSKVVAMDEQMFMAQCGIYEQNLPIMEVSITVGSRSLADKIIKNFDESASEIYKGVYELLGTENKKIDTI